MAGGLIAVDNVGPYIIKVTNPGSKPLYLGPFKAKADALYHVKAMREIVQRCGRWKPGDVLSATQIYMAGRVVLRKGTRVSLVGG